MTIAGETGQSQILSCCLTIMLLGNDMVYLMGINGEILMEQTIFAPPLSTIAHQLP
jgi:hypothetical protein